MQVCYLTSCIIASTLFHVCFGLHPLSCLAVCLQMLGKGLDDTPNPGMLSATPIPLASSPTELPVSDLFSAHDFDIQIDLPSPDDSKPRHKLLVV